MNAAQFDEFFESLYGYGPFPWQAELARQVAEARPGDACWPKALALPTAAGKTACIDMAIFALACQADRTPGERTAPRRTFFIVDRRVIVDETFGRARRLAEALHKATSGILKDVADRLRLLAQEDDPLACFQLRGGMYRDDAWARSPLQPTVVVTTVDQFGSRLLFRGYGSSAAMRPVHAGLAANDCLLILDEAHCANPFRQTVTSVQSYRKWASRTAATVTPFHLTLISATPPLDITGEDRFADRDKDRAHPVLGRRINASKPAILKIAEKAQKKNALKKLAQQVAAEAVKLVSDECKAIGVIVNRVATARLVYEHLDKDGKDVVLLTGRMRAIDRDEVLRDLESLKTGKTGADREERTRFIVATQTLEVGADLDFDGLVTECASLDALRQRFGRLNRDGRSIDSRAVIVIRADQTEANSKAANDPVYGEALTETWQWLSEKVGNDGIDFGYTAMHNLLPDSPEELAKLCQQAPNAPVMLPAHLDAWVQTSPIPHPDPDVSPFLHGPNRGAPEVQVCWRADLHEMSPEQQVEIVSLCPPVSSECISVPIHSFRRWLEGTCSDVDHEDSDVEGTLSPDKDFRKHSNIQHNVICWRGPEESRPLTKHSDLADLRPGDTVVIQEELQGWETFGHIPAGLDGKRIIDLGDRAHLQSRAKAVLRTNIKVVESWPDLAKDCLKGIPNRSEDSEGEGGDDEIQQSLEALAELEMQPEWEWLKDAASALARDKRRKRITHPGGGFVLQGSRRVQKYMRSASTPTSEDYSSSATVRVTLADHLEGVKRWARRFGEGVGLPSNQVNDLTLAGRSHDVGKADPRFQAILHGGHPWAALVGGPLLAKSGNLPSGLAEYRRACRESGYPRGSRHELLSVRLIESVPGLLESAHDEDLVLHLVASHHGRCRPFAPVVADDESVKVEILGMSATSVTDLERLDSGVPERFWRLVRRYGWWSLAWLETLMRLADHRSSEAEQKAHDDADSQAEEE